MSKPKIQVARSLDEKIRRIISGSGDADSEFSLVSSAYILGFNYSNVTNCVGLTTNYQLHHAVFPVVGLAYFKSSPTDEEIKSNLSAIKDYSSSPNGLGSFKSDKNEHLFLIYSVDEQTKEVDKKVLNLVDDQADPLKISILDDAKIFNHSVITRFNTCLKLDILDGGNKLASKERIDAAINSAQKMLSGDGLKLHLSKSNFSTSAPLKIPHLVETLYSHLEIPSDVEQMGDYLPQMTKDEKKKIHDRWRNRVKDQRAPLDFQIEVDNLTINAEDGLPAQCYKLNLTEEFIHLSVNDPISKATAVMTFALRHKLEVIRGLLHARAGTTIEPDEIKSCTFKLGHFIPVVYMIPSDTKPNYEQLKAQRKELHTAYIIPTDKPALRYSQRVTSSDLKNSDEQHGYLCNVHLDIMEKSGIKGGTKSVLNGTYTYHHYLQDRAQDSGWGCAYRSLQTIISWFKHQGYIYSPDIETRAPKSAPCDKTSSLRIKLEKEARAPTHEEIQTVLVDVGDKQPNFIGSQKWIGSQEVCYVLSHLYDLESKFISVNSGSELVYKARDLGHHFVTQSTPVMIGGGVLAHTIIGIDFNEKNGDVSYLILDPHYTESEDLSAIIKKGWCGWKKNAFWDKTSFYNLCLPQRPCEF